MKRIALTALILLFVVATPAGAEENRARESMKFYQTPEAKARKEKYLSEAKESYQYYLSNKNEKKAEAALIGTCNKLILAEPYLYEDADLKCGMTKQGPDCFDDFANDLNGTFGSGAFYYWPERVQMIYTASHCQEYINRCRNGSFKQCKAMDEAEIGTLRGQKMIGNDLKKIFGYVESWMTKYPKSRQMPKAYLLLARLHADAWILFHQHSFISEDMLVTTDEEYSLRASKHRFFGLKDFDYVLKESPGSEEGRAARRERELLDKKIDDGILYGISY